MSDFTRGPWVAIPATTRWHFAKPVFSDGLWHILPANDLERLPICEVDRADDHDELTRQHAEVDARLIAAAPELLGALQAIQRGFADGSIQFTKKRQSDSDPYHPANTLMCDAIAKVEGR